jgi:hypothetical protein
MAMAAKLAITLTDPGFIVGVQSIDFMLDGNHQESMQFGDRKQLEIAAGEHTAQVILRGLLTRTSNELKFSADEDQSVRIKGKYSRRWGNISLSQT